MKYKIIENMLSESDLLLLKEEASGISFRPCPHWLGYFKMKTFDLSKISSEDIPEGFRTIAQKILPKIKTEQSFNTIFIQKYEEGNYVKPHFDPRNNKGITIIVPFGTFEGGLNKIEDDEVLVKPGNILVQKCTTKYGIGPKHSLGKITSGTRYALIFNTIIKENNS